MEVDAIGAERTTMIHQQLLLLPFRSFGGATVGSIRSPQTAQAKAKASTPLSPEVAGFRDPFHRRNGLAGVNGPRNGGNGAV